MSRGFMTSYSYDCEVAVNTPKGQHIPIPSETIKYIMVNHDYYKHIMPVLYMKVRLNPSAYEVMVPLQGKAKVYLKLFSMRDRGATSSSPKKVIYDEFDYFMTDDPNAERKIDTVHPERGAAYKECTIGLMKIDLQKKNQKTFENVYKNTDSITLVHSATSDLRMVIQPFDFNTKYDKFVCPNINSIGQFIAYLNQTNAFYKGTYMYYMDHDKTYLRSNDGSYIDAKDGQFKYVALDIRDLTSYSALTTGMVEDPEQDAYIIYVPAGDAKIIIDRATPSVVGAVDTIDAADGTKIGASNVATAPITNINTAPSTTVSTTTDSNGARHLTTKVAETSDTLIISKVDMDARIFTPNKQYLLCNYEDNPKYCGVYFMVNKKEIYLRAGDNMTNQITITFKKCADFV